MARDFDCDSGCSRAWLALRVGWAAACERVPALARPGPAAGGGGGRIRARDTLAGAAVSFPAGIFFRAALLVREFFPRVVLVLLIVALFWAATRVTRVVARAITDRLVSRGRYAERSLISLARRIVNVAILIFLVLVA